MHTHTHTYIYIYYHIRIAVYIHVHDIAVAIYVGGRYPPTSGELKRRMAPFHVPLSEGIFVHPCVGLLAAQGAEPPAFVRG